VRAFHARTVAIYFGLLILFRVGYVLSAGESLKVAALSGLWLLLLCTMAVAILALMAWAFARSTIYSITDKRIVIRFGVALPMAVNIPFKAIESVGLRRYKDGVGDIPMSLGDGHSVNYLIMWPNVRPWRFWYAQPMLRGLPDVDRVGALLADALKSANNAEMTASDRDGSSPASQPQFDAAPAASG
jgi:hypothetical protein